MSMKNLSRYLKSRSLLLIFLIQIGTSNGKAKSENSDPFKLLSTAIVLSNADLVYPKQIFISNRDSYLKAANSYGSQVGSGQDIEGLRPHTNSVGSGSTTFTYRVPQNSYNAPTHGQSQNSVSYEHGVQNDDNPQSSKGSEDVIGLVGLLGLKGLKGTLPFVKLAAVTLLALAPVLIPLTLLKLFIILLKPVITFGRSFTEDAFKNKFEIATLKIPNWKSNEDVDKNGLLSFPKDIYERGIENQCMQRIACEGLLKSIPRIFMRILGENYTYNIITQRKLRNASGNGVQQQKTVINSRRKDLATLALNKLKRPQFLIKKPSLTEEPTVTQKVCTQYKCTTLF